MAASRCHVKYLKDGSALESMAASRCYVKCFKDESALKSMQYLGVMLNVLKMSRPLRVCSI